MASNAMAGEPKDSSSPRIAALAAAVQQGDAGAEQAFWDDLGRTGTPLVEAGDTPESMRLTVVVRGNPDRAWSNAGIMTLRTEMPFTRLERVPGTSVWSHTWEMSRATRGMYLLSWPQGRVPDAGAAWVLPGRDGVVHELFVDPLSRLKVPGTLAPDFPDRVVSAFEGDLASPQPYLGVRQRVNAGRIVHRDVDSRVFAGRRAVSVYLPAGYAQQCRYDWLIMFDADQYLSLMAIDTILDNMIADGAIAPVVAVLIHSGRTRLVDLPPNERSQAFLRDELIPWVRENYAVSDDSSRIAIAGFSHGALAAMNGGLRNSDLIGNVVSHSGSFWWAPDMPASVDPTGPLPLNANSLSAAFARADRLPLRVYMDVGSWEGRFQIGSNRQLRDVLIARGYPVAYHEYEGPHDYIAWRATLPDGLIATLGANAPHDPCNPGSDRAQH